MVSMVHTVGQLIFNASNFRVVFIPSVDFFLLISSEGLEKRFSLSYIGGAYPLREDLLTCASSTIPVQFFLRRFFSNRIALHQIDKNQNRID